MAHLNEPNTFLGESPREEALPGEVMGRRLFEVIGNCFLRAGCTGRSAGKMCRKRFIAEVKDCSSKAERIVAYRKLGNSRGN